MKTLKFMFPAIVFMLLAFSNVNAQSVSTKIVDFEWMMYDTDSPELGIFTGTATLHLVRKYDRFGNEKGARANIHFTNLTSDATGEIFLANCVVKDVYSTSNPDVIISKLRMVLIGNKGTRIVCDETVEFNIITGDWVSIEHNHKQW